MILVVVMIDKIRWSCDDVIALQNIEDYECNHGQQQQNSQKSCQFVHHRPPQNYDQSLLHSVQAVVEFQVFLVYIVQNLDLPFELDLYVVRYLDGLLQCAFSAI